MDRQTEDGGDSVFFVVSGCPDGFPLEASKAPVSFSPEMVFFQGKPVGLGLGRDHEPHLRQTGGNWYLCRTFRCESGMLAGLWEAGTAGLWNQRQAHGVLAVTGSIPFRR